MERTHLERRDLDWLPPRYRVLRWTIAGSVWTGTLGAVAALFVATHGHGAGIIGGMSKGFAALFAGGYIAGDRAARRVLRGRLQKLAHGAVDPARLPAEPDGELVHVVGRVRSHGKSLPTSDGGAPVIWRRVVFSFNNQQRVVHEAAVDFWLVGDSGEPIAVETAEGRLLVGEGKRVAWEQETPQAAALVSLLPPSLAHVVPKLRKRRKWKVRAADAVLREGDRVEILGYKSRTVDPTVAARLERDTPYRASLRGGQALPLLITPRPV